MAATLSDPKPAKKLTDEDRHRITLAEQKRLKRETRNRTLAQPKQEPVEPEWGWEIEQEIIDGMRAEWDQERRAMREVSRLVRRRVYRDILEYIEECESTSDFSITTEPYGDRQDEGEYAFECAYVYQYCNGGYTGDSYAGSVCIPLNAGKFLKFHYAM